MGWYPKRWAREAGVLPSLLALVLCAGSPAQGADGLYDVAKLSVDITAQDAVAARTQGMAEAGRRAVNTVIQRLTPLSAQAQIAELTDEDVQGMVNGVSIRKEQNSTTRYIATLDVSVNEQAIKRLLQEQGIPYSEQRAPSISLLPLVIAGDSVTSEGGEGWRQAWEDLDLSHSTTPATVLRPRQELDIATVRAVLAGDAQALAAMQGDYGYGPLVIAVGEATKGEFVTRLAGADSVGVINFGRSDQIVGDAKSAAREAAATAFAIIENRWKVSQSGESAGDRGELCAGNRAGAGSGRGGCPAGRSPAQCGGPGRVFGPQGLARHPWQADERSRNPGAGGQFAVGAGRLDHLRLCRLARPVTAGARPQRLRVR